MFSSDDSHRKNLDAPITCARTVIGLLATRKVMGENPHGHDATCKVMGIGIMKIKTWDGVTGMLSDVRHVLALKKNLIFLSSLDAN